MSDAAVYERYKDALRRGHVAATRGRFDAALVAYADATKIAPERALPHASMGAILHRNGRDPEALAAFDLALQRAPRDEMALSGRADVLSALGRPVDAAHTLDLLAEAQEGAGHLPEACDSARRALELAESRARRRHVERLAASLRERAGDEKAAAAFQRAVGYLGPASAPSRRKRRAAEDAPAEQASEAKPLDGGALIGQAEAVLDGGDAPGARDLFVQAAAAQRAAGHVNAAIDACYLALAIAPGDPELHVTLAELYLERGWRGPAAEKLLLLGRLIELTGETAARERLCRLVGERFADDPRLVALCA
jgi:tetratricopeptide (TPR) repeat protein